MLLKVFLVSLAVQNWKTLNQLENEKKKSVKHEAGTWELLPINPMVMSITPRFLNQTTHTPTSSLKIFFYVPSSKFLTRPHLPCLDSSIIDSSLLSDVSWAAEQDIEERS